MSSSASSYRALGTARTTESTCGTTRRAVATTARATSTLTTASSLPRRRKVGRWEICGRSGTAHYYFDSTSDTPPEDSGRAKCPDDPRDSRYAPAPSVSVIGGGGGGSAPMEDALIGTRAVKDYHRPWHGRIFRDGEGRLSHIDSDHPSNEGCYLNVEPDGSIKFLMHKDGGQIHTGQYRQETDDILWSDGEVYIRQGGKPTGNV